MSTDTDLVPVIEVAIDHGVHVEVAAWTGPGATRRLNLPGTRLPWCHRLDLAAYDRVRDPRDYGRP